MKTEDLLSTAGETFEYGRIYLSNQKRLIRLEVAEKLAKTTSSLVTVTVLALLGSFFMLFLSIAGGFWLGSILGSYALGFLVITAIYGLFGGFMYFMRASLVTNPILMYILNTILDDDDDDNDVEIAE